MRARVRLPAPGQMTHDQRAIYEDVLRSRGNVQGPFLAWLLSPGLADPAQRLGAFCRYGTTFSLQESELLILLVAAHHDCAGEQQIHEPIAIGAGLSEDVVRKIRAKQSAGFPTPRLALLGQIASDLLATNRIADASYARGVAEFGDRGMVELVGIVGYYAFVAYTLNAFEMKVD